MEEERQCVPITYYVVITQNFQNKPVRLLELYLNYTQGSQALVPNQENGRNEMLFQECQTLKFSLFPFNNTAFQWKATVF